MVLKNGACASFHKGTEMRNLHAYLNLSLAASSGEMGEHVKAASDGAYEGMRGEYAPLHIPKEDKAGLLSRRSMQIALLGGLGSALPGTAGAVGAIAAGLHSERGLGGGTALGTVVGNIAGHKGGVLGRAAGGALGAALGHEYFRRKYDAMGLRR